MGLTKRLEVGSWHPQSSASLKKRRKQHQKNKKYEFTCESILMGGVSNRCVVKLITTRVSCRTHAHRPTVHNCQIGHIAGSTLILSNQMFGPKMGLYFQESSLALFGLEPARGFALTSALTTLYFDTVPHVRSVVPTTRRDQVALTH